MNAHLKTFLQNVFIAIIFMGCSFVFGFWFTSGAKYAGGLLHITIEQAPIIQEQE